MKMLHALTIFALAISAICAYDQDFYCKNEAKLCKGFPYPHLACANEDWDYSFCSRPRMMVGITQEMIDTIVDYHNTCRSQIATGAIADGMFGTVARMATIQWDEELASLAEIHAKTCVLAHSNCRNTPEYTMAGENLYIKFRMQQWDDDLTLMKHSMKVWFDEYNETSVYQVERAPKPCPISHFLCMGVDRQTRIGCAMSRFSDHNKNKKQLFVCEYATMPIIRKRIFIEGPPASECKTGENPNYPGLCNPEEDINPNDFFNERY